MLRKSTAILLLIVFTLFCTTCRSTYLVEKEDLLANPDWYISELVTTQGEIIKFSGSNVTGPTSSLSSYELQQRTVGEGALLLGDEIVGVLHDGSTFRIPLDEVQMVIVSKTNPAKTIFMTCGVISTIVTGALVIVALTKESCPFVYSFDGEGYVFDGEPYGRAICSGLQRTDWCRLDHLATEDGSYRIMLTNEVNETQYTDELSMIVVDHPAGVDVIPDADGTFYTVGDPLEILSAESSTGGDISMWLDKNDQLYWYTDFPPGGFGHDATLRDTILVSLPRIAGMDNAKLLVNCCNTLWGSQMLRRVAELYGDQVDLWYAGFEMSLFRDQLYMWDLREEVFLLGVSVWNGEDWIDAGRITGGGPLVSEDRVIPLELAGIQGDILQLRLTPPIGFWKINWIAVDYSREQAISIREVHASTMDDPFGALSHTSLDETDGVYFPMPEVGQWALLEFEVPEERDSLDRTVFAQASGYYDMHLDPDAEFRPELTARILNEPGFITRFAAAEFSSWLADRTDGAPE